jgi:hypothetical protein
MNCSPEKIKILGKWHELFRSQEMPLLDVSFIAHLLMNKSEKKYGFP